MPSRELSFPVFDADNHMYEPQEALTKYLPDNRKNVVDYVQVRGRTKIVVRGHISEYIPTRRSKRLPARRTGGLLPQRRARQDLSRDPRRADEGDPRFREPGARLEVMDELGIDYALMFPTLASLRSLKDPISFVDELSDFGEEDVAKIMGGNLMKLMKVAKPVSA